MYSFKSVAEPQLAADTLHSHNIHKAAASSVQMGLKQSCSGQTKLMALLLLSQGGNSCRPQWDGVKGVGKSVMRQY